MNAGMVLFCFLFFFCSSVTQFVCSIGYAGYVVWPLRGQGRDCRNPAKEELLQLEKALLPGVMGRGGRLKCRRLLLTLQGYGSQMFFRIGSFV